MKGRVAHVAALFLLGAILCLSFFILSHTMSTRNADMAEQLSCFVETAGTTLHTTPSAERAEALKHFNTTESMSVGLYGTDGKLNWKSEDGVCEIIPEFAPFEHLNTKFTGRVGTCNDSKGDGKICAVYSFDDGETLIVYVENWTLYDLFVGRIGAIWLFALIFCTILMVFVVWRNYKSKSEMIVGVMKTLEQFSEGDYDARIPQLRGSDSLIAKYNTIIERVDDRIFKQRHRNQVVASVLYQMENGVIAVDRDLKVIIATPVARRLLGYGETESKDSKFIDDPLGKHINDVSRDVPLDEVFTDAMRQFVASPGVITNEVRAKTAIGFEQKPLRLYISAMYEKDPVGNNRLVGALAMIEDITELHRLAKLRTDFAANVSHELRTPLTSIKGFVETLNSEWVEKPPFASRSLDIILSEIERLNQLIDDILSISKLESGNTEVSIESVDLTQSINKVIDMLAPQAEKGNVKLIFNPTEPISIMANPGRIQQILWNLIYNGIKYNKPEGGTVTVNIGKDRKGERVDISVLDTGIGIDEEHLPRLCERFYRVDKARSSETGGTGLGLSIVKHIVRQMNGELEISSTLGVGSQFLITLPLTIKDNPDKDTIFDD